MRRLAAILPILLTLCVCLCAFVAVGGLVAVPARAANAFGPPAANLSPSLRLYYGALLLLQEEALTRPTDPSGVEQTFLVQPGDSAGEVIANLQAAGLLADAAVFRAYLLYSGLDKQMRAGRYQLSPAMPPLIIARMIGDPTLGKVPFQVLPGWRIEEIASALPTSGLAITPQEFLAAAASPPGDFAFTNNLPASASLEGFLFPDVYYFSRTVSVDGFIGGILENFTRQLTPEIQQGFFQQDLDLYDGIILASIVQREAMLEEEMPVIASVFLNRLAIGMPLESDPTVQYALGYNAVQAVWWTNPLSAADVDYDSPYNTYIYPQLPPGPIANPGLAALRAAAFPAQTPYYFFRAACDGSGRHNFAEDYQAHLANECP
ncbi:MAG: endolytic transglycosylase MltG [Chloroflexi bacterium]|nr:endolytic transglycosylase MltG [Chloroflexota bacterium]